MQKGGLLDGAGSEWDESEHPRDEDGKFANKNTSENRSFINIQLFAANYSNQTDAQLKKSRRGHEKQIEKHTYKIAHPEEFVDKWEEKSQEYKRGLIERWQKEVKNIGNQIAMIDKEFEKRRKNNGS